MVWFTNIGETVQLALSRQRAVFEQDCTVYTELEFSDGGDYSNLYRLSILMFTRIVSGAKGQCEVAFCSRNPGEYATLSVYLRSWWCIQ